MSWNLSDVKYGWKILAGIALTGTTIFVADNIIQRIYQRDMIQIVLGTHERCLATQYQTNPPAYYVSPPSFVRNWYSNSYETTNVPGDPVTNWYAVLHTNIFTNIIGWRTDRTMMVALDAKIKALVPYYVDTNTVYDGTTNIVMLTVTGLWASLGIGDRTNKFTRTPEWIGTNGVTNAATYGDYPWRIYVTDLQERYKVLNALVLCFYATNVVTNAPVPPGISLTWTNTIRFHGGFNTWGSNPDWETVKSTTEDHYQSWGDEGSPPYSWTAGIKYVPPIYDSEMGNLYWEAMKRTAQAKCRVGPFPTNEQEYSLIVQARSVKADGTFWYKNIYVGYYYWDGYWYGRLEGIFTQEFTSAGAIGNEDEWVEIINVTNATTQWQESAIYGSDSEPAWCVNPTSIVNFLAVKGNMTETKYQAWYGPLPAYTNVITNYIPVGNQTNFFINNYTNFSYCTNKYW